MSQAIFPRNACNISDEWAYKDMPVIFLENDLIRVGILVGRGSDIFEFTYKPLAVDLMLRLPKGIRNPQADFSQMRNTSNQLEDYYYGGWQECLPNSPAFNYRGASLGQHGEVSLIPWRHSIVENTSEKVSVKLWVRPLRVPVFLEKTLTINRQDPVLHIEERLTNESRTSLDIMWGHHVAFGLPFLQDGGKIITNADSFRVEPQIADPRKYAADQSGQWPKIGDETGQILDATSIPPADLDHYNDLAYLSNFKKLAYYGITDQNQKLGFGLTWDPGIFKNLWYWQERYATQGAPWWGDVYAVGLEPWTSEWTAEPEQAIENGDWLKMQANETVETQLKAWIFEGQFKLD